MRVGTCAADCGEGPPGKYCGDGSCGFPNETYNSCSQDCGPGPPSFWCGDGKCALSAGESPQKCPHDCNCNTDANCSDGKVCYQFACINSCKGKCGKFSNLAPCQCDSKCAQSNDCCPDKAALCGG